ncbi:MAG: hypothetical protein HQL71_10585 [Magnetococcales bacterium]|nr:hypothetical protein [Magnetococcales bacterium]
MHDFMAEKPEIFSEILTSFINYESLFRAFADQAEVNKTADDWINYLAPLKEVLEKNVIETKQSQKAFSEAYKNVKNVEFLLEQSIKEGWQELADEEQEMTKLATAIGALSQQISDLGADVSSAQLRAGKAYIQTSVTISYGIAMGTVAAVPFLSFAGAIFTIGYSVFDTIKSAKQIQKDLDHLTELQNDATQAAQAAAITKAVLQLLYKMSEEFLKLDDKLPSVSKMWQGELDKLNELLDALKSGSDPSLLFDLGSIKIAAASWGSIVDFVKIIRKPPQIGKSVLVNTMDNTITQQ